MKRRVPPVLLGALLLLSLPALVVASVRSGSTGAYDLDTVLAACRALWGGAEPVAGHAQAILELRLWRALTAAGVGAALGLSGALVQGLFRNGLAAPSILGVTGGASLGAALAILALGGFSPLLLLSGSASLIVPAAGFVGAVCAVVLVTLLASGGGRVSVPALLLTGIAVNTTIAGVLALISSLALADWEVSRALMAWTFGTLDDRSPVHVVTVWVGLALAAAVVPFVAWELDLFQAGEEDARALGVRTGRVRALCVAGAALSAAAAVAVAGQIAFVGLIVPHLVRLLAGRAHRAVLPLSVLLGAVFMLGVDTAQRALLGERALQPGVTMALVGGPAFIVLLLLARREVDTW
jgi:iron complex transport system permease protein